MNLQNHIGTITKVAEVAGKEYSIEQVSKIIFILLGFSYCLFLIDLMLYIHKLFRRFECLTLTINPSW